MKHKSKIFTVLLVTIAVLMMPLTVMSGNEPPAAISEEDDDEDEEDLYDIFLPIRKGVSYIYDQNAYDEEWSDEEYIVLKYAEKAKVSFTVNSSMSFEIDNMDDDCLFIGKRESGEVSFKMPDCDLELCFIETPQTEPPTEKPAEPPTEPPTEKPTEPPTEKPSSSATEKPSEKDTEKPTGGPAEKETNQTQEQRHLVFLPTEEGISYAYDNAAYSKDFSSDYYTVLSYRAGDPVNIEVKGNLLFEIINEESERVFMEMRDSGPVSFQMPDYDVEIRFKAEVQQPGETNPGSSPSTGSSGNSSGTGVTYGDDWCICLPVKKGVTYTYDNKRFDPEFSDEEEIYLDYDAGEPVSIGVNASEKFEIVEYDSVDEKVVIPMRGGSGTVSFPMPETDLEMVFEGDILQKDPVDKTKGKETQKTKTDKSTSGNGQVTKTASGTGTDAAPDQTEGSAVLQGTGASGVEYETTAFMETEMLVSANNGVGSNGQFAIRKDETADPERTETSNPAVVIKIGLDVPVLVFQLIIIIIQLLFIIMCYKKR